MKRNKEKERKGSDRERKIRVYLLCTTIKCTSSIERTFADKRAINRHKVQIPRNLTVQQDLDKLSARHHLFRDKIHVVITVAAELVFRDCAIFSAELLKQILEAQRCAFSTVVAVAVYDQDLEAYKRAGQSG